MWAKFIKHCRSHRIQPMSPCRHFTWVLLLPNLSVLLFLPRRDFLAGPKELQQDDVWRVIRMMLERGFANRKIHPPSPFVNVFYLYITRWKNHAWCFFTHHLSLFNAHFWWFNHQMRQTTTVLLLYRYWNPWNSNVFHIWTGEEKQKNETHRETWLLNLSFGWFGKSISYFQVSISSSTLHWNSQMAGQTRNTCSVHLKSS